MAKVCAKSSALHALSSGAYSVRSVHVFYLLFICFSLERTGEVGGKGRQVDIFAHVGLGGRCVFLHHAVVRAVARRTVAGLIHMGEIYPLHKNDASWRGGSVLDDFSTVDYHKDSNVVPLISLCSTCQREKV